MVSTLSVGDEMVIFEPAWPAYRDCANFIGVKVKAIKTSGTKMGSGFGRIREDDNT